MRHPFQCLEACSLSHGNQKYTFLVAAAGPQIKVFNLRDGSLCFTWPQHNAEKPTSDGRRVATTEQPGRSIGHSVEPGEKRKFASDNEPCTTPAEPSGAGAQDENSDGPPIINLTISNSGRYVVVGTGEDKCVKTFELGSNGRLKLLRERCMPKRPCALVVTPDESDIICGDKFGDVYSIPLLSDRNPPGLSTGASDVVSSSVFGSPPRPSMPAANNSTVHTARNQRALEHQLRIGNRSPQKVVPKFEHRLLLGHVSLLTDLQFVTLPAEPSTGRPTRQYIITSDRDEHIRISRGPPQSHVIEGFCLGHTDFVSRLTVCTWRPELLISGGGETEFYVWLWEHCMLLQKIELSNFIENVHETSRTRKQEQTKGSDCLSNEPDAAISTKLTPLDGTLPESTTKASRVKGVKVKNPNPISGIWDIPLKLRENEDKAPSGGRPSERQQGFVIIACERLPALFVFRSDSKSNLHYAQTLYLQGNALDITCIDDHRAILVSIDNILECSTTLVLQRKNPNDLTNDVLVQKFLLEGKSGESIWMDATRTSPHVIAINQVGSFEFSEAHESTVTQLQALLYSVSNLKKRIVED